MARSARLTSEEVEEDPMGRTSVRQRRSGRTARDQPSPSPSPAASLSSDKENRAATNGQTKGKTQTMPPPDTPISNPVTNESARANKRRKLGERSAPNASQSQAIHQRQLQENADVQYYDPDQPIEERREIRKNFRQLSTKLADSRAEYMQASSTGLKDTIDQANDYFRNVKQTSDATLDSRLLVTAADLSAKKTSQLVLGDNAQGIDVDEFVSKCINFMRRGPSGPEADTLTSTNPRRRRQRDQSDEDVSAASGDEGDAFNWAWLGRKACFPNNLRPPVPGFLLGPLSVQKRARKQTQRRERLQKRNPKDAVRPDVLLAEQLEKVDNANLTTLCKNIRELLAKTQREGEEKINAITNTRVLTDVEANALLRKHCMCNDGGVELFSFAVNPQSFGQTVENLFYISFLIRDGSACIQTDSNGIPTLHATNPRTAHQIQAENIQKHQAVFHLDFPTWHDIVDAFEISECIIPHRRSAEEEEVVRAGGNTGWRS